MLQAIRLAGMADRDAILDRAFVPDEMLDDLVTQAQVAEHVEWFSFGDSSGWIITEAGAARLAVLLRDETADRSALAVLEATLDAFEPLNTQFVETVSRWQLQSTSPEATGSATADPEHIDALLTTLTSIEAGLREVLAELISVLPRFGRYPSQFTAALDRARREGLGWVTGIGLLSCHVVWAELHQDLLSSACRNRPGDAEG